MDIQTQQFIAAQLRKPDGEHGINVALQMNEGNAVINRLALAQLQPQTGDKILEVGMGNGHFVGELLQLEEGLTYTGCDYSALMVAEAEKINTSFIQENTVSFSVATADELPFDNNTFDRMVGINILYFWENPATELAEIKRVLKPGGTLTLAIRPKDAMDMMPFTQFGFTKYSEATLVSLLQANGYVVLRVLKQQEPETEFNGVPMRMASLIITASAI